MQKIKSFINRLPIPFRIFFIPCACAMLLCAILLLPWLLIMLSLFLIPNPPTPQITYGEFPFWLEYTVNGEHYVVKDTLICQYDGIGINKGSGKYRKWSMILASGNSDVVLYESDEILISNPSNISYDEKTFYHTSICLCLEDAAYYMGDCTLGTSTIIWWPSPNEISLKYVIEEGRSKVCERLLHEGDLSEEYDIKILSWEIAAPIVNSFE